MNTTSSSFSFSSLHSPLIIVTCVLSILTHVAQCLLSLPGRKREKEDKWGGVASERAGGYGVGRAERRWANDREREREEKSYPFHLSLSPSVVFVISGGMLSVLQQWICDFWGVSWNWSSVSDSGPACFSPKLFLLILSQSCLCSNATDTANALRTPSMTCCTWWETVYVCDFS